MNFDFVFQVSISTGNVLLIFLNYALVRYAFEKLAIGSCLLLIKLANNLLQRFIIKLKHIFGFKTLQILSPVHVIMIREPFAHLFLSFTILLCFTYIILSSHRSISLISSLCTLESYNLYHNLQKTGILLTNKMYMCSVYRLSIMYCFFSPSLSRSLFCLLLFACFIYSKFDSM